MWRISAFVAHCLLTALDQLGEDRRDELFTIWHATFEPFYRPAHEMPVHSSEEAVPPGLLATPLESDYAFFGQTIDEELARLATMPTNAELPCGHNVHEHKDALKAWQENALGT